MLSLFPNYFQGPLSESMIARAQKSELLEINCVDIRDYCKDKHKQADDRPYGGGPGMVMMAEPVSEAIRAMKTSKSKVVYLSPQGKPLDQKLAKELSKEKHLILLCGHYEGVDQRVLESDVDMEISIGDYVLTNGCLAACVLIDVVARFVPGVLGHPESSANDSFEKGRLDCPHYTRPQNFEGKEVPEVLLSGNHQEIDKWRQKNAFLQTQKKRPDLNLVLGEPNNE
ncbi:MAG: tRNA (guanine-N(1)-)-methyltransferase [Chlamydiae bacterium]|nr:tRNA (guanine-N(1)-)-methyltransferase [Chlamydiota bacterium]